MDYECHTPLTLAGAKIFTLHSTLHSTRECTRAVRLKMPNSAAAEFCYDINSAKNSAALLKTQILPLILPHNQNSAKNSATLLKFSNSATYSATQPKFCQKFCHNTKILEFCHLFCQQFCHNILKT